MEHETTADPRHGTLPPTQDEIDAWATREQARRKAWLEGPGEVERFEWARRRRRRAALGLGESKLGPTEEEIDAWAEQERQRRRAWLEGPTQEERRAHERRTARHAAAPSPAPDEVDAWARRESQRRRAWIEGPTVEEKQEWARQQSRGLLAGRWHLPAGLGSEEEVVSTILHEAGLVGRGTMRAVSRVSRALLSYLVQPEHGDEERDRPRRRVPYEEGD